MWLRGSGSPARCPAGRGAGAQASQPRLKHPLHQEINPWQPVLPAFPSTAKSACAPKENNGTSGSGRQAAVSHLSESLVRRQTHAQVFTALTSKRTFSCGSLFLGRGGFQRLQLPAQLCCLQPAPTSLPRRQNTAGAAFH